jgi:uncharacterized membrane protein
VKWINSRFRKILKNMEEYQMIKKKKLLIISLLAAVALLVAGLVGSQVYAQSNTSTTASSSTTATDPQKVLADKVATILGLDATTVENAFAQAQKEIQSEALDNQLKQLVDAGSITQAQADAYKAWLQSKPDVKIPGLDGGMGFGHNGPMGGRGMGGFNPQGSPPPVPSSTNSASSSTN